MTSMILQYSNNACILDNIPLSCGTIVSATEFSMKATYGGKYIKQINSCRNQKIVDKWIALCSDTDNVTPVHFTSPPTYQIKNSLPLVLYQVTLYQQASGEYCKLVWYADKCDPFPASSIISNHVKNMSWYSLIKLG